ncbi:MAG: hypothetical protein ABTQ29_10385 [Siculibacillus sp.]
MIHTLALKGGTPNGGPRISVTLKLFALLSGYLPEGAARNEIRLAVPEGTTPGAVIAALDLPPALCALVLVDGVFIPLEERDVRPLLEGEALSIWPPIAGG